MAAYQKIDSPAAQLLAAEHRALISLAIAEWDNEDAFSDAQVAQVKAVFAAVFEHDRPLRGWTIADALMFYEEEQDGLFYVATVCPSKKEGEEAAVVWLKLAVRNKCFGIDRGAELEDVLMFLGAVPSAATNVDSTRAEILGDRPSEAASAMRPSYSPDLVRRVTGRAPDDATPILREAATLHKMLDEALRLGFKGDGRAIEQKGELHLDFVDVEALNRGYAPESFTVAFYSDYPEMDDPKASGVFAHPKYGPGADLLSTWSSWDRYLDSCIRPVTAFQQ